MNCGHDERWLAYRNPVDVRSDQYCVFCELERLRSIVDRLQKTRDGVSVTPGMRLWHGGIEWTADTWAFRRDRPAESVNPEFCYSSEAAEKART